MMSSNSSNQLNLAIPDIPLVRYRIRFREVESDSDASTGLLHKQYLGSAWRGAFGRMLKKTVCVTHQPICDSCALLYSCPYPLLFENRTPPNSEKLKLYPRTPVPFVLEPEYREFDCSTSTLNLGILLVGKANDYLPYVVHSLERVAQHGLTKRRIKLELQDVQAEHVKAGEWYEIYTPGNSLFPVPSSYPNPPSTPAAIRVNLISPLRLKFKEHLVGPAEFNFRIFATSLIRRMSLLSYFFGNSPFETNFSELFRCAETIEIHNQNLKWREWTRHSSRQNTHLQMGGLVGTFDLSSQELEPFWPSMWLGQWTHIGKGCTMGLGRYVVERLDLADSIPERNHHWAGPLQL